jgi:hypothetical protein
MKVRLCKGAWAFTAIAFAMLASSTGCGKKEDLNKAKTVVETALTSWKNGESADKLVGQGIEITDEDWKVGSKLLNFTIKDASSQPQQGPRVVVMLNMQRRNGKKVDSEVAYEVIFGDKTKIGRDAFHVPK